MVAKAGSLVIEMRSNHAKVVQGLRDVRRQMSGLEDAAGTLRRAFAAIGLGFTAAKIVESIAEFEKLKTTLVSVTGSQEYANKTFGDLQTLAKNTPFQLSQITEGYIKLRAFGLDPLNGTYQSLIDQAAKLGGSQETLNGVILAVGQAWAKQKLQGEEILQLVERGVPVWDLLSKATGKNVQQLQALSQQGKLGRKEIQLLLDEIGKSSAGAAAAQMDTLNGAFSNLKDSAANLANALGEAGLTKILKAVASGANNAAQAITSLIREMSGTETIDDLTYAIGEQEKKLHALQVQAGTLFRGREVSAEFKTQIQSMIDKLEELRAKRAQLEQKQNIVVPPPAGAAGDTVIPGLPTEKEIKSRLDALSKGLLDAREKADLEYQEGLKNLQYAREQNIATIMSYDDIEARLKEQHTAALFEIESTASDRDLEEFKRVAEEKKRIEKATQDFITNARAGATNAAIGLLQTLGQKNKTAAKLAILIGKAQSIQEIIQNTAVAATASLKYDQTGATAARIKAYGATQAALVAATGALQISQVGTDAGGLGTPANPISTTPATDTAGGNAPGAQRIVNVTIYADTILDAQSITQYIGDSVRTLVNDNDVILVDINSRNGQELIQAAKA